MPIFHYEAMDSSGRQVTAEIQADTSAEAMMRIRALGYFPTKVNCKTGSLTLTPEDSMIDSTGTTPRIKPHAITPVLLQARSPWWAGAIFAMVGLGVMTAAWILGAIQHYRLATYRSVAAHIMDAHVRTIHGKHTSYAAAITYSYNVSGTAYQSSHVFAIPGSSSSSTYQDANAICLQYPSGSVATAWVSPTDASSVFLVRDVSPMPYVLAFFSLPFFASGAFMLFARIAGSRIPKPTAVDGGWFQLAEVGTIRRRFWLWFSLAVCWYIYAGTVVGDYLILHGPNQMIMLLVAIVAGILGFIPLWFAWRYRRLMHDFHNAQVRVNLNPVRIGNALTVEIRQSLLHPLDVEEFSIGLVCIEDTRTTYGRKTTYSSNEACSVWKTLVADRAFGLGEEVAGQTALATPDDANPSGAAGRSGYPYYRWYIALYVKARGEPKLNAHFPLKIDA